MTPQFATELKALATKHAVPIMVNIAVDEKTGIVQLIDFGMSPSGFAKATRVKNAIARMFKATGIFA